MAASKPAQTRLYAPRRFNPRSKQRFRRDRAQRLVEHIGGDPSDMQLLLIERVIEVEWSILRLSACADQGGLSQHRARELLAFHNHLRLLTRELGLRQA